MGGCVLKLKRPHEGGTVFCAGAAPSAGSRRKHRCGASGGSAYSGTNERLGKSRHRRVFNEELSQGNVV